MWLYATIVDDGNRKLNLRKDGNRYQWHPIYDISGHPIWEDLPSYLTPEIIEKQYREQVLIGWHPLYYEELELCPECGAKDYPWEEEKDINEKKIIVCHSCHFPYPVSSNERE